VGNVLAVFRTGAQTTLVATAIDGNGDAVVSGGLEGIRLPVAIAPVPLDDQASIAKAITGAYLSSEGNAFTTRTANQIVQEHFNPGETNQPGGPLFGVQFSQLACSDFTLAFQGGLSNVGPKRSPLGLSADPGGLPLYKEGTVVGGVGVISDGRYGVDAVISDTDRASDELIAVAASFGFGAPLDRRADRITVEGKTLRFSDVDFSDLVSDPAMAPPFTSLGPADGDLVAVFGYTNAVIIAGTAFGESLSGIRPDNNVDFPGQDAFVFVDNADQPRFAPIAGTDGGLSANEVRTLLSEALGVAARARAQIRRPLGDNARVTISVVDTNGVVLGMVRSRDAPVFGADVSLQKARTAALFSSAAAAGFLASLPDAKYIETRDGFVGVVDSIALADYVTAVRVFLGQPTALADGAVAFSDRAGGNLSRPFFPDGIDGSPPGPFSKPAGAWSPFSTGLQLDLAINAILQHVLFVASAGALLPDVGGNCAGVDLADDLSSAVPTPGLPLYAANGTQIFPGSVPIYRNATLLGGIGVSGDGIDQDDMIAFLGLHNAGAALGTVNNAPTAMRADQLTPMGVRLRYVQCPQAPFLDSSEDNVCDGK
ncbi:MAG: heme-binding protein, partial [Gammaproteobacteria bacterium]|nr:heme-binding protein [Gammaproteobacteria bacterium]